MKKEDSIRSEKTYFRKLSEKNRISEVELLRNDGREILVWVKGKSLRYYFSIRGTGEKQLQLDLKLTGFWDSSHSNSNSNGRLLPDSLKKNSLIHGSFVHFNFTRNGNIYFSSGILNIDDEKECLFKIKNLGDFFRCERRKVPRIFSHKFMDLKVFIPFRSDQKVETSNSLKNVIYFPSLNKSEKLLINSHSEEEFNFRKFQELLIEKETINSETSDVAKLNLKIISGEFLAFPVIDLSEKSISFWIFKSQEKNVLNGIILDNFLISIENEKIQIHKAQIFKIQKYVDPKNNNSDLLKVIINFTEVSEQNRNLLTVAIYNRLYHDVE
jgi:hypothetical protein